LLSILKVDIVNYAYYFYKVLNMVL